MLLVRTSIHAAHVEEIAGNATGAKILVRPERIPQSVIWKEGAPSPCQSPRPLPAPSCHGLIQSVSSAPVSPPSRTMLIFPGPACLSFLCEALLLLPLPYSHTLPSRLLPYACTHSGLSGTRGMFANRVLDSCLPGLRLVPNHEGRSSEPARSGRTQWLSSCSLSLKKS